MKCLDRFCPKRAICSHILDFLLLSSNLDIRNTLKQMKNGQVSTAVLWMFSPPGLRMSQVTENYAEQSSNYMVTAITLAKIKSENY